MYIRTQLARRSKGHRAKLYPTLLVLALITGATAQSLACDGNSAVPPPPPDSQYWVATAGVGFPPWTFSLSIKDGRVTGTATQGNSDTASGYTTSLTGPFEICDGKAVGDTITFTLRQGGNAKIVTFKGARTGDQIAFTRSVQLNGGPAGMTGIVGAQGATQFVVRLAAAGVPLPAAPSAGAAASRGPRPLAVRGDEIVLLGTHGGPFLTEARSEPASLLIVDGTPYLIDCGVGTMRRLIKLGVPSPLIGTIFITHDHPDHALGLADVLENDLLVNEFGSSAAPSRTYSIYGPPPTDELVSSAYNYIRAAVNTFAAEGLSTVSNPFVAHVIDHDGLVYQDDKIRVTAAENTHFQLLPAQYRAQMKSYAYRFETPYGVIVFTGDTGPSEAVTQLAQGADVLVSEVTTAPGETARPPDQGIGAAHQQMEHLPMKSLGAMATTANVKAVILTHFVGGNGGEPFVDGVKPYYAGPIFAGEDLARYCLGRPNQDGADSHTLAPCQ